MTRLAERDYTYFTTVRGMCRGCRRIVPARVFFRDEQVWQESLCPTCRNEPALIAAGKDWYLAHNDVSVFVDDGTWYLLVDNRCRFLTPENRCRIYAERPRICRRYGRHDCEYNDEEGSVYDMLFESAEQIWEYAEAVLPPRRKRR